MADDAGFQLPWKNIRRQEQALANPTVGALPAASPDPITINGISYDAQGRPIAPEWQGIAGDDGLLKDTYRMKDWQNVSADRGALNALKGEALRDPKQASQWAQMMLDKQAMEQSAAMDQAARGGQNALLAAQSELAQSGGLSEGSRERMAQRAFREGLLAKQGANRQGALDRMNIGLQDEEKRLGLLNQVQGLENQQADIAFKNQEAQGKVDTFNLGKQFDDLTQRRMFDTNRYNQAMSAWGAGKSADAQAAAARSSGGGKK
jgi:hypothetical protein